MILIFFWIELANIIPTEKQAAESFVGFRTNWSWILQSWM